VTFRLGTVIASLLMASGPPDAERFLSMSAEEGARTWTDVERSGVSFATVNWSGASAPFKCFLLIRDGDFLCALRFTNFVRGRDARPSSFWTSGEETKTSVYEWHVLERTAGGVKPKKSGRGVVQFTAPHGFGHLIVGGGFGSVNCGGRPLGWLYPDVVEFPGSSSPDLRIAPTGWPDVAAVRLDDPSLVWYAFDESRRSVRIPRSRL
jgi:hypothetical protein